MARRDSREELLDRRAFAARLGIPLKTFDKRRERSATGDGPKVPDPDRVVARTPLWFPATVDAYAEQLRPRRRTAGEQPERVA